MNIVNKLWGAAAVVAVACAVSGCYADEELPPPGARVTEADAYEGFRPMYYNGYVVYYDAQARPFYYVGGRPFFISPRYGGYNVLVGHYWRNRAVYGGWYGRYGVRYRTYRRW